MIKKILLVMGVAAFSVLWLVGFKKVMELPKTEPRYERGVRGSGGK